MPLAAVWKGGEGEARTEARAAQESGLEISTHRRHLPWHGPGWECPTRMHGLTGAEVQGGRRKEAGGKKAGPAAPLCPTGPTAPGASRKAALTPVRGEAEAGTPFLRQPKLLRQASYGTFWR